MYTKPYTNSKLKVLGGGTLTYAGVGDALPDGPLEKAGAAVAAVHAVVLAVGLVAAHLTQHRDWQRASCMEGERDVSIVYIHPQHAGGIQIRSPKKNKQHIGTIKQLSPYNCTFLLSSSSPYCFFPANPLPQWRPRLTHVSEGKKNPWSA